ncbi:hypothetical protein [Bythopirellula goksoeyrii]|uniref:hypothetical protein n=1 Tax=Bythopirellula goksoeyrii TaxID=1400387 RepID=UPI0011CD70F8|nr:hypothetical protein [Bythopirellula goksoeyrii]
MSKRPPQETGDSRGGGRATAADLQDLELNEVGPADRWKSLPLTAEVSSDLGHLSEFAEAVTGLG